MAQGKQTTLSHLYLQGIFIGYLLEDQIRENKIAGTTCIPEGDFQLRLNENASMNTSYKIRYPKLHQGMIEIANIKTFSDVFIHIGNYHYDTRGCPLVGHYWSLINGDYQVNQSAFAYQLIYPILIKEIHAGNTDIQIINQLIV